MTKQRFRFLVVVAAVLHVWYYSLAYNVYKLPPETRQLVEQSGHGAVLPLSETFHHSLLAAAVIAAAGLLFFEKWARLLYLAAFAGGILVTPLAGVSIALPFDGFIGSIAFSLEAVVLTLAYFSTVSKEFDRVSGPEEDAEADASTDAVPEPNANLVEVFKTSDESTILVIESLFKEFGIEYSAAGESLQDLFAGGRLGGHNFAIGPVRFLVREDDAARARELLSDLEKEPADEQVH